MRRKLIAGAAVLALMAGVPQVNADDDIVIFGSEFDEEITSPEPKEVEKPGPIIELPPPEEEPSPIEEEPAPVEEEPAPSEDEIVSVDEKPEIVEPQDKPPTQPLEQPEEYAEVLPQEVSSSLSEDDDDNLGDELVFDDFNQTPEQEFVEQPTQESPIIDEPTDEPLQPAQIEQPTFELESPVEIERPFEQANETPIEQREPVIIVPPMPQPPLPEVMPYQPPTSETTIREVPEQPARQSSRSTQPQKNLKPLKPRFLKLAVDDTYTYYLDKTSVQWKQMPYSSSEYIADVWIRMVEREPQALDDDMASYGTDNFNAEISLAREQGYQYSPDDLKVLSSQAYVLEHYYLRPKTKQIQFLCELEVFGRPQNAISERVYDYRNWENLVPGSVESVIYEATIKILGKSKSNERGHMTFVDMLEEYGRISLR